MPKYCDLLPRDAGIERCQVLTADGFRCKRRAKLEKRLHGDPELDGRGAPGENPSWVAYYTCNGDHREDWEK